MVGARLGRRKKSREGRASKGASADGPSAVVAQVVRHKDNWRAENERQSVQRVYDQLRTLREAFRDKGAERPTDAKLRDIQQTYDELSKSQGKAPSQRAVARQSGYARNTVREVWPLLKT